MRGIRLCIAIAIATGAAFIEDVAEARECADHVYSQAYRPSRPAQARKSRRVHRSRNKLRAPVAAPAPLPKRPSIAFEPVKQQPAHDTDDGSRLGEMGLEWIVYELALDDPRRADPSRLRVTWILIGILSTEARVPVLADQRAELPVPASLRARLLPKLPDSGDGASLA